MRKVQRVGDPDFELVEKARVGDSAAFEELLSRHLERTRGLIFRLMEGERVDDLTQETFLLAYRNLSRFRRDAKFSTWLTRIAVNLCRGEWRKRKRRREDRLENLPRKVMVEVADANPGAPAAIMNREKGRRIDREIAALPPKLRITFTLRYIEGHSPSEVAAILGCKAGTVRSRLFNARQMLKMRLKELVE